MSDISDTYQILGKIGEGSGGIVYKAYHKRLQKEVVLKQIRLGNASRMMQRQEVDILKNLNHMYLPQVFDFLTVGQHVYTVMSYIPGRSFADLMKQGAKFSRVQLLTWAMQLCDALVYLHGQRPPIIHSDIKPANIMLKPDGNICLIDFNISFFMDGSTILGYSHGYTSPEQYAIAMHSRTPRQLQNYRTVDERTDVYSVGATFYYLATGIKRLDFKLPPNKALLEARLGKAFTKVILRAMEIEPEKRYSSAYEMFTALSRIPEDEVKAKRQFYKKCGIWTGVGVFVAAAIVAGGFGMHQMKVRRVEQYNQIVKQQIEAREKGKTEVSEKYFEQAIDVLPNDLEAFYQNAYTLYAAGDYDACIDFIGYDVLENEKLDLRAARMADIYYLRADCLFRKQAYGDAVQAYKDVFAIGTTEPMYYRDAAIALAYNGEMDKAQEKLDEAINLGLENASVDYAMGEISKVKGDDAQALNYLKSCLKQTEDEVLKERAWVLCADIYAAENDKIRERQTLMDALSDLSGSHQLIALERLIQVNIDLADDTDSANYRADAIEASLKVIDNGWDTYQTYDNLVILYQKQGALEEAQAMLDTMQQKFGDDYNIYKRYAFLEIDRQELLANRERDYTAFKKAYENAKALYDEGQTEDAEMQLLDSVYAQVQAGGWI